MHSLSGPRAGLLDLGCLGCPVPHFSGVFLCLLHRLLQWASVGPWIAPWGMDWWQKNFLYHKFAELFSASQAKKRTFSFVICVHFMLYLTLESELLKSE